MSIRDSWMMAYTTLIFPIFCATVWFGLIRPERGIWATGKRVWIGYGLLTAGVIGVLLFFFLPNNPCPACR